MTTTKRLIVIAGPTAVGKTKVAIDVAKALSTEIVSFDSRQLFKELNIGTAKPTAAQLVQVKHHFISSHSIHDIVNTGTYAQEANALFEKLFLRYDSLVFTGGTGLYMDAVLNGIDDLPQANALLRLQLAAQLEKEGLPAMANQLQTIDPESYKRIDLKNPRRVLRVYEVFKLTGKPFSELIGQKQNQRNYTPVLFCLNKSRKELYENINHRVEAMLQNGLEQEVRSLIEFRNLNALHTVGYTEMFHYFDGLYSLPQAYEKIKQATRNYAKRQLTWFKRYKDVHWLEGEHDEIVEKIMKKVHR